MEAKIRTVFFSGFLLWAAWGGPVPASARPSASAEPGSRYEYRVKAGFVIGGTSPLPLPAEIRRIQRYSPVLAFALEGNVLRRLGGRWALLAGLRFETKGMNSQARVKNYRLLIDVSSGDETGRIEGMFTGRVRTEVRNDYLTLPLEAVYRLSPRWEIRLGPYFSYLLRGGFKGEAGNGYIRDGDPTGTKIGVESATYDFSGDVRRFDWGADLGAGWKAFPHLSVYADFTFGAVSVFHRSFRGIAFPLHNIYLNLGFSYVF